MKYNNIWIVVPTYWGHRGTPDNPPCTQFDHPTSLEEEGTLGRTLESIMKQEGEFNVLLVVVGTHDNLFEQVHTIVRTIAKQHNQKKNVCLVSNNNYQRINEILQYPILRLDSYGSIRNVQLLFPIVAGADLIIAIDDDEIIPDSNFVNQIKKTFYNARISGTPIYGGAGPYYSAAGDYHINEASIAKNETNLFLKKNYFMDLAVSRAIEVEKINKSNVAFGGNMYFSHEIALEVCHDPYSPRGEDYDYVMNAKLEGFDFYFNPHTKIVHLPPDSNGSQAGDNVYKLVADIYRFIYMQEKFNFFKENYPQKIYDISYIQPYPGEYLLHDLYAHAEEALMKKYPSFCKHNNPKDIVYDAINMSKKKTMEYVDYLDTWKSCMKTLPRVSNNFIESFLV